MVEGLFLVVLCGEPGRWPDVGFVSWFREGRSGRARSVPAAVRAVPQAGQQW